jgi:K+-sensing histidine kinase KdpD
MTISTLARLLRRIDKSRLIAAKVAAVEARVELGQKLESKIVLQRIRPVTGHSTVPLGPCSSLLSIQAAACFVRECAEWGVHAGEVAIKAEANNGSFYVSVRDTGPGISSADQARLFQEFQQADNAITKKKGGTGLGLAISKRIIEMHGGRIWVESQPGQGSTFTFTLPVIVERQVEAA